MNHSTYTVRRGTRSDAPEIARLLSTLGHPSSTHEIIDRWTKYQAVGNVVLVVPMEDGSLAGLATLNQMSVLHRAKPVGRISALVVDRDHRGKGIGRALVVAAEKLLADAGCGLLEITSNERLVQAHDFYERLGYERTSVRVAKTLAALTDTQERNAE